MQYIHAAAAHNYAARYQDLLIQDQDAVKFLSAELEEEKSEKNTIKYYSLTSLRSAKTAEKIFAVL